MRTAILHTRISRPFDPVFVLRYKHGNRQVLITPSTEEDGSSPAAAPGYGPYGSRTRVTNSMSVYWLQDAEPHSFDWHISRCQIVKGLANAKLNHRLTTGHCTVIITQRIFGAPLQNNCNGIRKCHALGTRLVRAPILRLRAAPSPFLLALWSVNRLWDVFDNTTYRAYFELSHCPTVRRSWR